MLSDHVKEMIPKIRQFLASQPIEKAWLFGSCSRGEETPGSDVDLVEEDRLLPFAQKSANRDKILIYERKG